MIEANALEYLAKLKHSEEELKGPAPEALYDRLERERPQLEAAMRWFLEHEHPQRALELASLVWRFWVNRGHLEEGRSLMKAALQASSSDEQSPLRADALHGAGTLAFQQGDNESAREHFEQSLSIGRRLDKTDAVVRALQRGGGPDSDRSQNLHNCVGGGTGHASGAGL